MAVRKPANKRKSGSTSTRKVTKGPNKGDTVRFKVAPGGKEYPTRVTRDTGSKNQSKIGKSSRKKK